MPRGTVRRPVEVHDPQLSERANRVLTEEVRAALGRDTVEVDAARADELGRSHPRDGMLASTLESNKLVIAVLFAAAVVLGAILAVTLDSWWWLVGAVCVHALATLFITGLIVQATTNVESPSPRARETLEAEGVRDPERTFNDRVREFTHADQGSRTAAVLTPGENVRTVREDQDPGRAAPEQQTAMTPSSEAVDPQPAEEGAAARATGGSAPPVAISVGMFTAIGIASILVPALAGGGWLWLCVAIVLPFALAGIGYQLFMLRRSRGR